MMALTHPHPTNRIGYLHGGWLTEFRHQDTDALIGEAVLPSAPVKEYGWYHGVGESGALTQYDIKAIDIVSRQVEAYDEQGEPQDVGVALCYSTYIVYVKEPA